MNITREWLREMNSCYSDERIAELIPEEGSTLAEVLDLPIPALDRVWVATRPGVLTYRQLVTFSQGCAARARGYADFDSTTVIYADAAAYQATRTADAAYAYVDDYSAAAASADYSAAAAARSVDTARVERETQVTHLKQLIAP